MAHLRFLVEAGAAKHKAKFGADEAALYAQVYRDIEAVVNSFYPLAPVSSVHACGV
jgi:hypothetical protein